MHCIQLSAISEQENIAQFNENWDELFARIQTENDINFNRKSTSAENTM